MANPLNRLLVNWPPATVPAEGHRAQGLELHPESGMVWITSTRGPVGSVSHEPRRILDSDTFDALLAQMAESWGPAGRATESLNALTAWTKTLTVAVEQLAGAIHRIIVPVNALPRVDLVLRRGPLYVSVEQDAEDEFVAEISEVGAAGYGNTVAEAVDGAVQALCDVYDEIITADPEVLGPRPRRWQAALRQIVEKVNG